MSDDDINTSDIPPLCAEFLGRVKVRLPGRIPLTVRVDADVVRWFQAQGDDYEQHINAALRMYAEVHKVAQR